MDTGCNLGTDVGGTFTDLAWCTPSGELHCFKVPSTPASPGQSILQGVDELYVALRPDGASWHNVHHTHSSTVATNASPPTATKMAPAPASTPPATTGSAVPSAPAAR